MLPIYGALERIPNSFLEASSDLGAKGWLTFRRVVLPMIVPGIVAGSIFSFSLTLGRLHRAVARWATPSSSAT